MQFTVRPYRSGDEAAINDMFNEVFSQQRDLASWFWKFRDNPYGSYFISLCETEDGTLAAQYAGYPALCCIFDPATRTAREFLTLQLGDKMTRREFRAAGFRQNSLMARTYRHFSEKYADGQIPFCYGFVTGSSRKIGNLVLGYSEIEPIPFRRLVLDGRKEVSGLVRFSRRVSGISVRPFNAVTAEWTEFFSQVLPDYSCLIRKDETFLRWRYFERPDSKYLALAVRRWGRLAGWAVFGRRGEKLIWGDCLIRKGDIEGVRAILDFVTGSSIAEGARSIECWYPPRPAWWHEILVSLGFQMEAEPDNLHLTLGICNDPSLPELLKGRLYYSLGDSDLF
ncbi:MAG: hypothetical protein M0024_04715 [Nitrospiraceae bacterium]|nr:hypothetical protein [Nitrospiraceae bacterium]